MRCSSQSINQSIVMTRNIKLYRNFSKTFFFSGDMCFRNVTKTWFQLPRKAGEVQLWSDRVLCYVLVEEMPKLWRGTLKFYETFSNNFLMAVTNDNHRYSKRNLLRTKGFDQKLNRRLNHRPMVSLSLTSMFRIPNDVSRTEQPSVA